MGRVLPCHDKGARFSKGSAARAALASIRRKGARRDDDLGKPMRVYFCEDGCKGWHLTSDQDRR